MHPQQIPLLSECGALVVNTGAPFCCFELSGAPRGKGAPRFGIVRTRTGKQFATTYKDKKTAGYMRDLTRAAVRAMGNKPPTGKPVAVVLHAYMPIPKDWSGRKHLDAISGVIRPTGKPDCDNIFKMVDALTGVVWDDDAPIVDARVMKFYSDEPGLRIEVREMVPPSR